MGWGRLDDGFHDHPKVEVLSLDAVGLWALCWSAANRHRKASPVLGFISEARARGEAAKRNIAGRRFASLIAELVTPLAGRKHGMWEPVEGGWLIHDYESYLPRQRDSEELAEAGRRGGKSRAARQAQAKQTASNLPDTHQADSQEPASNQQANGLANAQAKSSSRTSARAFPSRPVPKEQEPKNIRSTESSTPDRFDEFWSTFPKRVAKTAAKRRWDTLVKRGVDPGDIIAGAKAYADQVRSTDPQFIKQPDGWLNAGRWEDEPPPEPQPAGWWDN